MNKIILTLISFFISLSAFSDTAAKSNPWSLSTYLPPEDISVNGHLIDALFNYTTVFNVFFFIMVCIGLFGFAFIYRAKNHPKPYYTYGNKKSHIMVATAIGLFVFLAIDMNITRMSNNDYTGVFINWPNDQKDDVLKIQVLAQQWAWNFRYAGKDRVFNTADDVVTLNDLRLPTGKKILFQLQSKDVIHSFFIANTRRKVDAIPGRITRLWFELKKEGDFEVACAEMCGTYHYRMAAKLKVYSPDVYKKWMAEAEEKALQENDPENAELFWGWPWSGSSNVSMK
jgi:cytochrome c oxidase subunit II